MLKLIEVENWKRAQYFNAFLSNGNLVTCVSVIFDCTEIYRYSKEQRVPFIVTMLHASLYSINYFEAFRMRIIDNEYVACYDKIDLVTTELSSENQFYNLYTPYTPSLKEFYQNYQNGRKLTKAHGVTTDGNKFHLNMAYFCALPGLRFTQVSPKNTNMTKRGCPFINLGKIEIDTCGKVTIPVGISFSHALLDGYDFLKLSEFMMCEYAKKQQ